VDVDARQVDRLQLPHAAIDVEPATARLQRGADRWRPVVRRCIVPALDDRGAPLALGSASLPRRRSRNKLGEAFVQDVYATWQKHGAKTLERMVQEDPGGFVRVAANILPDKLEVDVKHSIARIEWVVVEPKVIEHQASEMSAADKTHLLEVASVLSEDKSTG
jgi:hypothetical protein